MSPALLSQTGIAADKKLQCNRKVLQDFYPVYISPQSAQTIKCTLVLKGWKW
jgi:hypothetical protein